ncbi:MAG: gliding motility-associated C-terminal domain-containing protein [Ginsengibacter sp.]
MISGNKGDDGGGVGNYTGAGVFIINSTITGNTSLGTVGENNENAFGGGVFVYDYGSAYIYNSIVWGNTALTDNNLSAYDGTGKFYVINSLIEGGFAGAIRSLDSDPRFINPVPASSAPTAAGDYQVKCASPAINTGANAAYPDNGYIISPATPDLNFNTRIIGSSIDMGAYEYQTDISQNISIQAIAPGSPFRYCPGNLLSIDFTTNDCPGNFTVDNIFTLQLSDSNGNFSSPVSIGTLASALPGSITVAIPDTMPPGNNYRIRIISSSQPFISEQFNAAITILSKQPPGITISANADQICAGGNVSFTAVVTNGGASPVYQWKKNGNNVGTNSSVYSDNNLTGTDVIACEVNNNEGCTPNATAFSNEISITIITVVPTILISADQGNICSNETANFNAAVTGGGNNPALQWKKNGINVGSNSAVYSSAGLASPDIITCELISNAACANPSIVLSNSLQINITQVVVPAITIAGSKNEICPGETVTFTAIIANGGGGPVLQWKKNGVNVGTNNISFTDATLTSADVITCELLSNAKCASPQIATSNALTIAVGYVTPTITIHANRNEICKGETVDFSAVTSDGGNSPVYQWRKNGVSVGTNSPAWSDATLINSDIITCSLTSSNGCVSQAIVESNELSIAINPLPVITLSKSNDINCITDEAKLLATGGVKYEWQQAEGIDALAVNNPIVDPSQTTVYTVKVISDKNCYDTKAITVNVSLTGKYEIPNSFTPNNDGKNDCFGLSYLLNISDLDFSIYNRWGQKVFYTKNPKECWDGKYKGHEQESGIYVYIIKATGECGPLDKKGTVLLIR